MPLWGLFYIAMRKQLTNKLYLKKKNCDGVWRKKNGDGVSPLWIIGLDLDLENCYAIQGKSIAWLLNFKKHSFEEPI